MPTLYRAPWSTNVQRVTMALAHKGIDHDSAEIDYADRAPVIEVSAQPLVPVWVDDDGTVTVDSMAIVAHLERLQPDPPLYPSDPARRAELDVFVDWFNRVYKYEPNAIEAAMERGYTEPIARLAAAMQERLDVFEDLLAGRDFLFGAFSAADCCAYPFLKYAAGHDPGDDERFHRILEEHQSLAGRPRLEAWIARVRKDAPPAR